uniref:Peptidase A1 domain-containing protein n=1 Tax=Caenorhabditis tropicalis TaxID=1561998 RepID=A0A1I7UM60_9PELO
MKHLLFFVFILSLNLFLFCNAKYQTRVQRIKLIDRGTQKYGLRQLDRFIGAQHQHVADFRDFAYFGNITIGTPKDSKEYQTFLVVLDTGSSNLWVPDNSCGVHDISSACKHKNKFIGTDSSSYEKDGRPFSISYGTGSASGYFGKDTLCVSSKIYSKYETTFEFEFSDTTLCIKSQIFGQASSIAPFFANQEIDGILGLGFTDLAVNKAPPPFVNAVEQGLVDEPIFTVYLEHHGKNRAASGGYFTYGGEDPDHCGDIITWIPLTKAAYWQFRMQGIGISSSNEHTTGWEVISDTGTSFIGGPGRVIQDIAKKYGATYDEFNDSYIVPCSKVKSLPSLKLKINDIDFEIDPINLVAHPDATECDLTLFDIYGGGFGPSWILGDPFIRQFCNIHDIKNKRIGLAHSKQPEDVTF